MEYLRISDYKIYNRYELEQAFKNPLVSFPPEPYTTNEHLAPYGFALLERDPYPQLGLYQTYVASTIEAREGGHYFRTWAVIQEEVPPEDVDYERDRRREAGVIFQGVQYQTRDNDMRILANQSTLAMMAIYAGAQPGNLRWAEPDTDFVWIAEDNTLVSMDAQTLVAFNTAACAAESSIALNARNIKNMSPIPVDFADDKWWAQ